MRHSGASSLILLLIGEGNLLIIISYNAGTNGFEYGFILCLFCIDSSI